MNLVLQLGKNDQFAKHLSLLELFAYKTYQDYLGEGQAIPTSPDLSQLS